MLHCNANSRNILLIFNSGFDIQFPHSVPFITGSNSSSSTAFFVYVCSFIVEIIDWKMQNAPSNVHRVCDCICWHRQSISDWIVAHDIHGKNQHALNWNTFNYACSGFATQHSFESKQIDYVTTPTRVRRVASDN